ncbi:MAG: carboxypeptidase-like regulatory domain-containing protein, partial [Thermoanaerobaculia bacterium]|nr:carboxypeptidase-like regulatory domain-containing protein [Thermoanaerobaculia bacterium]
MKQRTLPAFLSIFLIGTAAIAGMSPVETSTVIENPEGLRTPEGLQGKVTAEASPLARAQVYAYELSKLEVNKVVSDRNGHFLFDRLPAGVYKLIAFKAGFEPAVVMLSRAAAEAQQFVELRLQHDKIETRDGENYWTLREEIPADVLRDIETARLAEWIGPVTGGGLDRPFSAALQASTGVETLGGGQSQISGAEVDMATQ